MDIIKGNLYFISDEFFRKVNDPNLKINYEMTGRPHYLAFEDGKTGLLWVVPCSSKVSKFEKVIEQKKAKNKPSDSIKITLIQGRKSVLLFQDMFPILHKYITEPYISGGIPVTIKNEKAIAEFEKTAKSIKNILYHGVKFTPTQPDIQRIESMMLEELTKDKKLDSTKENKPSVLHKLTLAKEKSISLNEPSPIKNIELQKER